MEGLAERNLSDPAPPAWAVALEYLFDTIKTRDDVRSKLGLACLGAIPNTAGKESFVEELKDPRSIVSEAYSAVVASLRFSTEEGTPKTLVVTSAAPVNPSKIVKYSGPLRICPPGSR